MITRILIRIKVVQMLYSYLLTKEGRTIKDAKKELEKSLDKAYELYISMLVLMIDLTDYHDLKLDMAKHKYLPTEYDINPNTRFADNGFIAKLRDCMDRNDVTHQFTEMGKVDEGGGGTIAYIMANYGMNVIDAGVPVLNMHAPWEIVSKADVYETYRCYKAFYNMEIR